MNRGTGITEHAINDNYVLLARAVVANAVFDYVATKHTKSMQRYVRRWMQSKVSGGNQWYKIQRMQIAELDKLCKQERKELQRWFDREGGELAHAADVYHYVRWIKEKKTLQPRELRKLSENARYASKILGE